jgi:hypothetical protein
MLTWSYGMKNIIALIAKKAEHYVSTPVGYLHNVT